MKKKRLGAIVLENGSAARVRPLDLFQQSRLWVRGGFHCRTVILYRNARLVNSESTIAHGRCQALRSLQVMV